MRTTWKFTALAKVGTRTTQPAMTGTPSRSSSIRSGAMVAGAALPITATSERRRPAACSIGVTVTCSCNPALQLLRQVPSIWIMPSWLRQKARRGPRPRAPPVIFNTSPGRAPMRQKIGGRQTRNGMTDVLYTRLRHAQRQGC